MEHRTVNAWLARLGRVATGWPRLLVAAGVAVAVILAALPLGSRPITALLLGWDAGVVVFLAALVELMISADTAEIRRNSARQDVGQVVVLALSAIAALASVVAIFALVSRSGQASVAFWEGPLGVVTIVLSWFFMHAMFAVHYAHEFYRPARGEPGGLEFPGDPEPDYWDFFYFAIVIGMAAQVSDVQVTSKRTRRAVTAHGIIAFWFNVAVLALLINIASAAIRG